MRRNADLLLCVFNYFDPLKQLEVFRKIHSRKLVFSNVATHKRTFFRLFDQPALRTTKNQP